MEVSCCENGRPGGVVAPGQPFFFSEGLKANHGPLLLAQKHSDLPELRLLI